MVPKEPLKLMPLADLKKVLAEIVAVPKDKIEQMKAKRPKLEKQKRHNS